MKATILAHVPFMLGLHICILLITLFGAEAIVLDTLEVKVGFDCCRFRSPVVLKSYIGLLKQNPKRVLVPPYDILWPYSALYMVLLGRSIL